MTKPPKPLRARNLCTPALISIAQAISVALMFSLAGCSSATPASTPLQSTVPARCPADAGVMDGWDDRAPPQRIFANTWYVETCGRNVLLITSAQGHVLIDGASAAAEPLIEDAIQARVVGRARGGVAVQRVQSSGMVS